MLTRELLRPALIVHDRTFGCVACFWQDLQDLTLLDGGWYVYTFPLHSGFYCLFKT
jgi:hypothetical protein